MEVKKIICKRCGYEWYPKPGNVPKECTKCKSYNYDKPVKRRRKVPHK